MIRNTSDHFQVNGWQFFWHKSLLLVIGTGPDAKTTKSMNYRFLKSKNTKFWRIIVTHLDFSCRLKMLGPFSSWSKIFQSIIITNFVSVHAAVWREKATLQSKKINYSWRCNWKKCRSFFRQSKSKCMRLEMLQCVDNLKHVLITFLKPILWSNHFSHLQKLCQGVEAVFGTLISIRPG